MQTKLWVEVWLGKYIHVHSHKLYKANPLTAFDSQTINSMKRISRLRAPRWPIGHQTKLCHWHFETEPYASSHFELPSKKTSMQLCVVDRICVQYQTFGLNCLRVVAYQSFSQRKLWCHFFGLRHTRFMYKPVQACWGDRMFNEREKRGCRQLVEANGVSVILTHEFVVVSLFLPFSSFISIEVNQLKNCCFFYNMEHHCLKWNY
jgi:hypothetical protein